MALFIVRVELRDSQSADYDELHEKLKIHGYHKYIDDSRGKGTLYLPQAEYVKTSDEGIYYVGHLANRVAEGIRPNPMILVTEAKDLFQLGLDQV